MVHLRHLGGLVYAVKDAASELDDVKARGTKPTRTS